MTRNEVFDVIKLHMIEIVEGLDQTVQITENDSMANFGADSIEMVDVVSASIRTLGIRVSLHELSDVQNLADLLDLLTAAVEKEKRVVEVGNTM